MSTPKRFHRIRAVLDQRKKKKVDYPRLGEDGEILDPLPR